MMFTYTIPLLYIAELLGVIKPAEMKDFGDSTNKKDQGGQFQLSDLTYNMAQFRSGNKIIIFTSCKL